jgi:hypothetical protein
MIYIQQEISKHPFIMSSQQIQRTIDNAEDEIFAQVFTSLLKIGMPAQKRTREDSSIDDGAASSSVDQ